MSEQVLGELIKQGIGFVIAAVVWLELRKLREQQRADNQAWQALLVELLREARADRQKIADAVGAHLESSTVLPVQR